MNNVYYVYRVDVDSGCYYIGMGIGIHDDSADCVGDKGYLMGNRGVDYLTEANLIYLIYGV